MKKTDLAKHIKIHSPHIHPSVFVASSANIIGDVRIGKDSSIWYNCVCRGDINYIDIGQRTNIQDGTVIHLENDLPTLIGNDVTVGHKSMIHACTIEDGALIGMGAIILNGAIVKKGAIVGAGAVVKENTVIFEGTLWAGVPAKQIKVYDISPYKKMWHGQLSMYNCHNYIKTNRKETNYPRSMLVGDDESRCVDKTHLHWCLKATQVYSQVILFECSG